MAEINSIRLDDYKDLANFLSAFENESSEEFWSRRFLLWWDTNPAFSENLERGWVLREPRKIIGFIGVIPSFFQLFGKETTVFNATTWKVVPEKRNQSLGLLFKQINAAKGSLLFATTSGEVSSRVRTAFGFRPIPVNGKNRKSVAIINSEKVLGAKIGGSIGKVAAKLIQPLFRVISASRDRGLKKFTTTHVREISKADSKFDLLWNRTKGVYLNTNVRRSEVLNWYCFGNQSFEKKLFGFYNQDQLMGYAIFRANKGQRLNTFECLDLWVDPSGSNVAQSLASFAADYAREHSMDLVIFPHFGREMQKYFVPPSFFKVGERGEGRYFKSNLETFQKIDAENSYFVGAQGDNGL